MSLGPIGVNASSASSATSISSASQSISFNPVITLASPESDISNQPRTDQTNTADARSTSTADAKAETKNPGLLGGAGDTESGATGFLPQLGLGRPARAVGGGPASLYGDLVPQSGMPASGMFDGANGLLLAGGLAIAVFFIVRRLL